MRSDSAIVLQEIEGWSVAILCLTFQENHGITARLEWSESGFRFFCYPQDLDGLVLPKEFVNVEHSKRGVKFSTRELASGTLEGRS